MKNLISILLPVAFVVLCECDNGYINWYEIEPNNIARKLHPGSKTKIQLSDPFFQVEKNKKYISKFTRHHIIPFSRVRLFFNNALKMKVAENFCVTSLYRIMNFFMDTASTEGQFEPISIGNIHDNIIMQMIFASNRQERENLFKNLRNFDVVKRHIHRFFVWFPANIFIGPTDRSDDPGAEFEINACYVIGYPRYNALRTINILMKLFNNRIENSNVDITNPNHVWEQGDIDTMHLVFVNFKNLLGLTSVPFNIEHWEKTSDTQWRIKLLYFGEYPNVYDLYSADLLSQYDTGIHVSDHDGDLRKKRSSWASTHGIYLYEHIERPIKAAFNASCVPQDPKCGCP